MNTKTLVSACAHAALAFAFIATIYAYAQSVRDLNAAKAACAFETGARR